MTIPRIKQWFQLAVPEPTDKNRAVQLGCHAEEFAEMLTALGFQNTSANVELWANYMKSEVPGVMQPDRTELLDAICDQIVTAVGVAHMFGLDIEGALAEVTRSNYSKFVDGKPVFDANGKIAKPQSYIKPDLTPFL